LTDLDVWLRDEVVDHRVGVLDPVFEGLSLMGSFGAVWLVVALAISGFSWSRPWLWTRVGAVILIAESVSGALKTQIGRDRPPVVDPDPEPIVRLPDTHSLPSGHATVAFACATVLALAVPRLAIPLYVLAGLIAFSRVYVGVHYPFDVLAGAVLGYVLARALRTLAAALRRSAPQPRSG
jgi:undecaprenyl-diphosphatase